MSFSLKRVGIEVLLLIALAGIFGAARQLFPRGIAWNGRWPTSSTSAEDAYKMMAREGDPGFVSLQEAIAAHESKSATFIDARSAEEFKAGHIPDSRTLPYYEMEQTQEKALEGLDTASPIIIYCEGIGCELSFFLGRDLQTMGFTDLKIFYGGYPEWKDAGLPIQK